MSNASLIVRNSIGEILYDTSKSVYGLVKSGALEYHGRWAKAVSPAYSDNIYKFVVKNGVSPILFTIGSCGKPFQSKEGNDIVFYFAAIVSEVRVYAFDLMRPMFSGPALKTRGENGNFTFNSLQWPLNIIGSSQPPPPSGPWSPLPGGPDPSIPVGCFSGGGNNYVALLSGPPDAGFICEFYDRMIDASKNIAAYIPWNRGCAYISSRISSRGNMLFGIEEGCTGIGGGVIRHHFWSSPETAYQSTFSAWLNGAYALTVSPRPTSLLIDANEYPYPFDPLS
ncbi:hypothetical protein [Pseudomonas gingeri]